MSYHTPTSTALDEIFIFSESDYITVDGNCYQKVVGDFGLSTHQTSNINSIELNFKFLSFYLLNKSYFQSLSF